MNTISKPRRGRPSKYAKYEELLASLPPSGTLRPRYANGIGVSRGKRGDTVWLKVRLSKSDTIRGREYEAKAAVELKMGRRNSWTWEQLEAEHRRLQGRADRGENLEEKKSEPFDQFAQRWLDTNQSQKGGRKTALIHVKRFTTSFGKKLIGEITTSDVNDWIEMRRKVVTQSTVKREIATLSSLFAGAVNEAKLDRNPCLAATKVSENLPKDRYLQPDEIVRLAQSATIVDPQMGDIFRWFLLSGMRKAEVFGLKFADIVLQPNGRHVAYVRKSKSGRPRKVHLSSPMKEIVDRFKSLHPSSELVFPISAITVRRRWRKIRARAGCSDVTMHDLRRTYATYGAASGVDLITLSKGMGHADLQMLQSVYGQSINSAAENAAERIHEAFASMLGTPGSQDGNRAMG